MPAPLANLHGKLMPLEDVQISVLDRSFLFGDAIYEVMRIYRGKIWLEDGHMERLRRSLGEIRIQGIDLDRLKKRICETIAAGPFGEAMVYVHISRGAAPRKHAFPKNATPLELMWVQDYDDGPTAKQRQTGAKVITHPDIRWGRCDIKTVNLLPNVLANQAATEAEACEALLYLPDGTMSEASHSSFFIVRNGVLQTTPLKANILPGITRNFVVELCRKNGLPLEECYFSRDELFRADEVLLTGTTTEVLPVVRIDDRTVANGQPGPATRRLYEVYCDALRRFLS